MNIYLQTLRKQDPDYYLPDKRDQTVELVLNALYIRINKCTTILKDESYSKYCDCICPLLDSVSKKCMTLEVCQAACVQSSGNWRFLPCPSKLFPDMKSSAVDAIYAQFYDKWDFHKFLSFESTLPLSDNEKKVIDAYIHMANLCFEQEKRESQIKAAEKKIWEMKRNKLELDCYNDYWNKINSNTTIHSYPITQYPNINLCPIILETDKNNYDTGILHSSDTVYNIILPVNDTSHMPVYYISDMHLECQLDLENKTLFEIKNALKYKADELSSSMIYGKGLICIAGDTSNSSWLFALFMEELYKACHYSDIISILGNHELFDFDEMLSDINEIRDKYANMSNICVLQNGLRVKYQGQKERILYDYNILEYSDEKLSEICRNSTQIVLGGTGFSGYEPVYNTSRIAWGNVVTTPKQEKMESDKFKEIYNKILRCAADQTVVVLTHTPMCQWFGEKYAYNPNWIYINGHTHQNEIIRKNGVTVLSDNQIGYEPSKFSFKCIPINGWYDPFENWDDGIYQITKEQYEIFNRGRGICYSFDRQGYQIYMVKRNTIYMFFAKGKSLCMLSGGRITKVEHDLTYYFDNLYAYQTIISKMFEPYNIALTVISSGIKQIGGIGTTHGCIVDIDFYNHIYLNPFDGGLTFYYATDMINKIVFPDLKSLLKEIENEELYNGYIQHEKDNLCPVLYSKQHKNQSLAVQNPELVLDTSMYKPSNVMRRIQYLFDQNVIRVWNDKILEQKENLLDTCAGSDNGSIYIDC